VRAVERGDTAQRKNAEMIIISQKPRKYQVMRRSASQVLLGKVDPERKSRDRKREKIDGRRYALVKWIGWSAQQRIK
jgi:hypothetical protein